MRYIKTDSKGRINVNSFQGYIDVKKVKTVVYKKFKNGSIFLKFLDSKGKIIRIEVEK